MAIPQSPGRAAATDRFMAQGGGTNAFGRYKKGPMKGKTYDEAMQMASDRWATASPEIRDKYARRAGLDSMAPSERAAYDAQWGDSSMDPQRRPSNPNATAGAGRGTPISTRPTQTAFTRSTDGAPGASYAGPSVESPGAVAGKAAGAAAGAALASSPAAVKPTPVPTPPPVAKSSPAPVPAAASTPQRSASDDAYATIADQRQASGYPEATRATPFTTPDVTTAKDQGFGPTPTPTGNPNPPRISKLTGLPFGYVPGDAVAPAQAAAAAASVQRQKDATAAYNGPEVPPKATLAPAPVRYEDAQNQYQKSGLDSKHTADMNDIYGKASDLDKARITAGSLKRARSI